MPWKPPVHEPLGRRSKAERDRDYARRRDPVAKALYGTARWRSARAAFLAEFPLCVTCLGQGFVRAASVVDHVEPHRGDPAIFWDRGCWQSLCASCHGAKTAGEDGGFGNRRRRGRGDQISQQNQG